MRLWLGMLLAALVLLGGAPHARADDARARAAFEAGNRAFARAQRAAGARRLEALRAALAAYDESLAESPRAITHFNRGIVLELLGDGLEAWRAFESFLRLAPEDDPVRPEAHAHLDRLATELSRLSLTVAPRGATVSLVSDRGERVELSSGTHTLRPGAYTISASAEGHLAATQRLLLSAGQVASVRVALAPIDAETTTPEVEPPPPPPVAHLSVEGVGLTLYVDDIEVPSGAAITPGVHRVRVEREGYLPATREVQVEEGAQVVLRPSLAPIPPEPRRAGAHALAATMGASAIVSGGLALSARRWARDADDALDTLEQTPNAANRRAAEQALDDSRQANRVADISLGISGALAAGTTLFYLLRRPDAPGESSLSVDLAPARGGATLSIRGGLPR